jgi:hypothetical protein
VLDIIQAKMTYSKEKYLSIYMTTKNRGTDGMHELFEECSWDKFSGYKMNMFLLPGRLTLINFIPVYYMTVSLLLRSSANRLTFLMRKFI